MFVGCVMGRIASLIGSHPAVRLALAGCLAGLLAGCANSERLADPFGNPFDTRNADPTPTGSLAEAAATRPVQSQPLAPPGGTAAPVPAYMAPAHPNPHLASARSYGGADTPATVGRRGASVAGWTAEGGMPVVVAQGETAGIVARRYGIPEAALLRTNGFFSAAQVRPGTRLVIPIYNAALAASSGVHVGVKHPERLKFVKGPPPADRKHEELAQAAAKRRLAEDKHERLAKAEQHHMRAELEVANKERAANERFAEGDAKAPVAEDEKAKVAAAAPGPKKPAVDQMPTASVHEGGGKSVVAAAVPEFRWPARGRIIQAFKIGRNDGINIALPEGTSVRAAEAGVVAYAGNELKGYGNLILIRHPNGFITAYANNAEIDVKRGETVKRGQVIAKSGETGNVSTPQLHFELRKGARPVDPTQYLAGA